MTWNIFRGGQTPSAPVDGGDDAGPHRSAAVDSGAHQSAAVDADPTLGGILAPHGGQQWLADNSGEGMGPRPPIFRFGAIHSAKEHAVKLLETLRRAGYDGESLLACQLEVVHDRMCEALGWTYRKWPSVGREFGKLVPKAQLEIEGRRRTLYQIGPPAETNNVVAHPAVERTRT